MLIASSTIASLTWRVNAEQMSSILGENVGDNGYAHSSPG